MKEIVVTVNLAKSSEYKITLALMLQDKKIRRLFLFVFLPLVFIITFSAAILLPVHSPHTNYGALINRVVIAVVLALFFGLPYLKIKMRKKPAVYTFDQWGITIMEDTTPVNLPWASISHYMDLPAHLIIFQRKGLLNTYIIPKANFNTPEELTQALDLLSNSHVEKR